MAVILLGERIRASVSIDGVAALNVSKSALAARAGDFWPPA